MDLCVYVFQELQANLGHFICLSEHIKQIEILALGRASEEVSAWKKQVAHAREIYFISLPSLSLSVSFSTFFTL